MIEVSSRQLLYDDLPAEPVRLAVCGWLRRHGIDPMDVIVPGWVERAPSRRQVEYRSVVRDGAGQVVVDGYEPAVEVRVVQLEAEPLPWPPELRGCQ